MHALKRRGADRAEGRAWVAVIERLWDVPAFEDSHRERALAEARRSDGETLAECYERLLLGVYAS